MLGDSAFCCLPIDIAVRLIGTISLLTNALIFIALVSDSDEILTDDKVRIIFGFNSQFFLTEDQASNYEWFPTFCLGFTLIAGVSSALLIWASIIEQRWLTIPWLVCSIFNVACHFTSLVIIFLTRSPSVEKWVIAFTILYSVLLVYFTIVLLAAHCIWCVQAKELLSYDLNQEAWENIYRSPPLFESSYKNQV